MSKRKYESSKTQDRAKPLAFRECAKPENLACCVPKRTVPR